jgi:acyl-CoA dehydrogenase
LLYVVARDGSDVDSRPHLRVAAIDATRTGVRFVTMPATPFVPELSHGEVVLEEVLVAESELLPGDGYTNYVKPFRTVEDLHVNAAVLAYLLHAARRHQAPAELVERLFATIVCVRALAAAESDASGTHLALAGLLALVRPLVDEVVAHLAGFANRSRGPANAIDEHARLVRDLPLLGIATKARETRRANAWAALATDPADTSTVEHPPSAPR